MGAHGGPNMTEDGVVFYYDTGNSKSYTGEPTENLITTTKQDPTNWTQRPTADKTLLDETYLGLPVYRLQDADGVDPDVYVDNYEVVATETGLTQGDTYTFSFYFRVIQHNNIADTLANNCAWTWYAGTYEYIFWNDFELNTWYRADLQSTVGATYDQLLPRIDYDNSILDICGLQFEKKPHATQHTTGTRSVTEGLKDFTKNVTLNLSNVSFDSDAQMTFDGTDDILPTGLYGGRNPSTDPFTVEAWVKSDTTSGPRMWVDATNNGSLQRFYSSLIDGSSSATGIQGTGWVDSVPNHTNWSHQVIVMDGSNANCYADGVLKYQLGYTSYTIFGDINIGGRSSYRWLGEIAMFKIYERALTAEEVAENFNGIRSRFGI